MIKNLFKNKFPLYCTLLILSVLVLITTIPVKAAEFIEEETISSDKVIDDDVFLTGGPNATMNGTINGMLLATSETVTINGTINGDAILMGNHIIISEKARISGNLFAGAAIIEIRGQIGGSIFGGSSSISLAETAKTERNLYYGGYSLETIPGSIVNRDLYAGVYQAILGGAVARNATIAAGAVDLNGSIGQNAKFEVGDPTSEMMPFSPGIFTPNSPAPIQLGLRISNTSKIGGQLTYTSNVDQASSIKAQPASGIVFKTPIPDEKQINSQRSRSASGQAISALLGFIRDLITLLILGGLALWLIPSIFKRTVALAKKKVLAASGYGFITIIAGYLSIFIAFILVVLVGLVFSTVSLGGLSSAFFGVGLSGLGLTSVIFTFLVSLGSKLVVAFLVGEWMANKIAPAIENKNIWALASGAGIYAVLHNIPYLGWLVGFVVTIIGMGAMWMLYRSWAKKADSAVNTPLVTQE